MGIDASCDGLFTSDGLAIIKEVLSWIRIIAPVALILLSAADLFGAVTGKYSSDGKENALLKAKDKIVKRIIAVLLIIFTPTLVLVILSSANISSIITNDYLCTGATGTEAGEAVESFKLKSLENKKAKDPKIVYVEDDDSENNGGNNGNHGNNGNSGNHGNNGGSGGNGNSGGNNGNSGEYTQVGDKANSKNTVCVSDSQRNKYNNILQSKIDAAGRYTRKGVVAAAVYVSSEIGIKIPYFPGGCHSMSCIKNGLIKGIGCQKKVVHNAYKWPETLPGGFDCSGFTFWSYGVAFNAKSYISSEMHNEGSRSTTVVDEKSGKKISVKVERVDLTEKNRAYLTNVLQPGDLIWTTGHIGMVISTSQLKSSGKITVADATSGGKGMQLQVNTMDLVNKRWKQVVLMRKFFLKYDCVNRNNSKACSEFDCINNKNCNSDNIVY